MIVKTGQKYRFNPDKWARDGHKPNCKSYVVTAVTEGSCSEHGWFNAMSKGKMDLFNIRYFDLMEDDI